MNKRNYQKELDKKLEELQNGEKTPTLFLHSCCAPCSSYVLEYLSRYFEITVFYYNPNIYPPSEYEERTSEQERLIREFNREWEYEADRHLIHFVAGTYVPDDFYAAAKGLEQEPEGGARCTEALSSRLSEAAREARRRLRLFYDDAHDKPLKGRREVEPDRGRDGRGVWCRIPALGFQEEKRI